MSSLHPSRPRLLAVAALVLALVAAVAAPAPAQTTAPPGPDARERGNGELVFQDAGRRMVAIAPTAGATPRVVQGNGELWPRGRPDVSPDGTQLLFQDPGDRVVRAPMAGGGDMEVLAPSYERYETSPVWRPDGAAFAYVRKVGGGSSSVDQEVVIRSGPGFWAEDTVALPPGGGTRRISFAPDGTHVAFDAHDPTSSDPASRYVGVLDLSTGEARTLWQPTRDGVYDLPDVSYDGTRVAFRSAENGGGQLICTVPFAGGDEHCVAGPDLGGVPPDGGTLGMPAWSPDGARIAFIRAFERDGIPLHDISSVPADGGDRTVHFFSGDSSAPYDDALEWAPAPAPVGGRIYLMRTSSGERQVISVLPDGTDMRVHTEGASPALSADGSLLAVVSKRDRPEGDVYVMTPGGRGVKRLTDDTATESDLAVSPDGRYVAFTRNDGPSSDVLIADVQTGAVRPLFTTSARREDPAFAPDGEHIAYATGFNEIHMARLDGSEDRLVTTGYSPAFTPDGGRMVVVRFTGSFDQLWVADVATGDAEQLTYDARDSYLPTVSPDGSTVAYSTTSGLSRVKLDGTADMAVSTEGFDAWWAPEPPAPSVTVADVRATEDEGDVTLTARLARAADADVTVRLRTVAGGDASVPGDHDALDTTVTIPAGEVSGTAALRLHEDALDEPDETIAVAVTATGATVTHATATVTIADDDPEPAMSLDDLVVDEGDIGDRTAELTVRLDAASGRTVRARVRSEDRTATAGVDYAAVDAAVTFAPGERTRTVPVTLHGDTVAEGAETVALVLSEIEHATAPAGPGTLTLREDDVAGKAPETAITRPPAPFVASATPSTGFIGSVPGGAFECRTDGGAWAPCTSPHRTRALADGPHIVAVRALDGALADPTPATAAFTVDTEAPETTVAAGPARLTAQRRPVFTLRASEPVARFDCRMDDGAWTGCETPWTSPALADGAHVFEARAVDRAGSADATPARHAFTVDATPPETTWTEAAAQAAGTGVVALRAGADGGVALALAPNAASATLPVACPADAPEPCGGELTLEQDVATAATRTRTTRAATAAATRAAVLGRARYRVAPGRQEAVAVPVPEGVRWQAERRGAVALRLRVRGEDGTTLALPLRLQAPAGPRLLQAGLTVPVRGGVAALRVACPRGRATCALRVGLRHGARVLGTSRVIARAGRTATARVRLGVAARRSVRTARRLLVTATVRRAPAPTRAVRLTLTTRGTR